MKVLLQEDLSKNTIVQLLIKNQEHLNKSVCNRKSVLDIEKAFQTVPKGPLKKGNNTETSTKLNDSFLLRSF